MKSGYNILGSDDFSLNAEQNGGFISRDAPESRGTLLESDGFETVDPVDASKGYREARLGVSDIGQARQRGDVKRESFGIAGEFGAGIARGVVQTVQGTINTGEELLGIHDDPYSISARMDRYMRTNQGGALGRGADTLVEKAAAAVGEQALIIGAIIGTGIVTGGMSSALSLGATGTRALVTAGTMTTMSAMTFGDNIDGIREASNGRLSEAQIFGMGFMSTAIQSALEVAICPEAVIGEAISLNAMRAAKAPLAELIAAAGKKTMFSGVKGLTASVFAESGTEFAQSIVQSIWEDAADGSEIHSMGEGQFKQAFIEALYAIPTAAIFGGFAAVSEHMVKSGILSQQRGLEASMEAEGIRYGTQEERDAAHANIDAAYTKFEESLAPMFGASGARAVASIMKEQAYHWAANGGASPEQLIETFGVILSDTTLSPTQIEEIRKITNPTERVAWMRNNVQGYREFEEAQTEDYRTRGVEAQYYYLLKRFRRIFGKTFGEEEEQIDAEAEADATAKTLEDDQATLSPADTALEAQARHAAMLGKVNNLRQMAAEQIMDLKVDTTPEGQRTLRIATKITAETSASMLQSIMNPDTDSTWIRPQAMRETLINMLHLNSDTMSREQAAILVEGMGEELSEGVEYTELQAAFMITAMENDSEGFFTGSETTEAVRVLSANNEAWGQIVVQERNQDNFEILMLAAQQAGLSIQQRSELILGQAHNVSYQGRVRLTAQQQRMDARGRHGREVIGEIDAYTESLLDGIAEKSSQLREMISAEAADFVAIAGLTAELEEQLEEVSGRIGTVKEGLASELENDMGFDPDAVIYEIEQQSEDGETIEQTINRLVSAVDVQLDAQVKDSSSAQRKLGELRALEEGQREIDDANRAEGEEYQTMSRRGQALIKRNQILAENSRARTDALADAKTDAERSAIEDEFQLRLVDDLIDEERKRIDSRDAIAVNMALRMIPDQLLESNGGDKILAHYNLAQRRAIFYKNSTAEDVLHEWFHHVDLNNLLPVEMREQMEAKYGITKSSTANEIKTYHEKAARDFVNYLKTTADTGVIGEDYPKELEEAFEYLSAVFAEEFHAQEGVVETGEQNESTAPQLQGENESVVYGGAQETVEGGTVNLWNLKVDIDGHPANSTVSDETLIEAGIEIPELTPIQVSESAADFVYSPETQEFFQGAFEKATVEEHHKTLAKVLDQSLKETPPVKESQLFESVSAAQMTDPIDILHRANLGGHDKFTKRIKAVLGKDGYEAWDYKRKWASLSIEQQREVATLAENDTARENPDAVLAMGSDNIPYFLPKALDDQSVAQFGVPFDSLINEDQKKSVQANLSRVYRAAEKKKLNETAKKLKSADENNQALTLIEAVARKLAKIAPSVQESAANGGGAVVGLKDRALRWASKTTNVANAVAEAHSSSVNGLLQWIDHGDGSGVFSQVIGDPRLEAQNDHARAQFEAEEMREKLNKKYVGALPRAEWNRTRAYGKEQIQLPTRAAVWIYMYTDKGRNKAAKKALFGSNADVLGQNKDSVLSDIIRFCNDYTMYAKPKANGGFSYSKVQQEGYAKQHLIKNYTKVQMEMLKWYHPMLNKVNLEATGENLGNLGATVSYIDGDGVKKSYTPELFIPSKRKGRTVSTGFGPEDGGLNPERDTGRLSGKFGSLQSRGRGVVGAEFIMDAQSIMGEYRDKADIFRAKTKTLNRLDALVKDSRFTASLRKMVGNNEAGPIGEALITMLHRERFVNGKANVDTTADRALGFLKAQGIFSVLAGRVSSMALQTASGPRVLGEIPVKDWARYVVNYTRVLEHVAGNKQNLLDVILSPHEVFMGEGPVAEMIGKIKKYNPYILTRRADPDLQGRPSSRFKTAMMGGFTIADMGTVIAVYQTSYESKFRELHDSAVYGGKKMTDEQIEVSANKFAARVVDETQPASGVGQRNLMQTERESLKILYPFTGDLFVQAQYLRHNLIHPIIRGAKANGWKGAWDGLAHGQFGRSAAGKRLIFSVLMPMTFVSLIRRRRLPEDEKEWAEDIMANFVSTVPVLGPIFSGMFNSGYTDAENFALAGFANIAKAGVSVKEGEPMRAVLNFIKGLSAIGGGPMTFIPWYQALGRVILDSPNTSADDKTATEKYLELLSLSVSKLHDDERSWFDGKKNVPDQ